MVSLRDMQERIISDGYSYTESVSAKRCEIRVYNESGYYVNAVERITRRDAWEEVYYALYEPTRRWLYVRIHENDKFTGYDAKRVTSDRTGYMTRTQVLKWADNSDCLYVIDFDENGKMVIING